jgi:Peptidase family M1 domain
LRARTPIRCTILVFVAFLAGCTVPIGPGFKHTSRDDAIGEVSAASSAVTPPGAVSSAPAARAPAAYIHVRVSDELVNIGNSALSYLDVSLPAGNSVRVANLIFRVNGQQIEPVTHNPGSPERIPFEKPWKPGDTHTIVFEYDLQPNPGGGAAVAASAAGFYITDLAAFPHWQPPIGAFAKADVRAAQETFEVSVPPGFLVLAPGKEVVPAGTTAQLQFRVTPADFPPFAIAGRYRELATTTKNSSVIFWTFDPVAAAPAQQVAERLAATSVAYERLFGPLYIVPRGKPAVPWSVHVVEAPAPIPPLDAPIAEGQSDATAALSFPQGILLDQRAFARDLASEPVLELAEYELAQSWFGWRVQVSPAAQFLLRDGIARFAVLAAAEARDGEPARRRGIAALIAMFDAYRAAVPAFASESARNLPIVPIVPRTPEERAAAAVKAALFFVALEELAGQQKFALALHTLVQDMAGKSVAESDLRAAMEAASGRDLAAMFRSWLSPADIPADFRARHRTP